MFKHLLEILVNMARRRTSRNRSTRRTKTFNITNTAQALIVANGLVRGASNANLYQFLTGRMPSAYGGMYQPNVKDNVVTLPELLGIDKQGQTLTNAQGQRLYSPGVSVEPGLQLEVMKQNIKDNAVSMAMTAVLTPIAFKLGKKVLSKAGVTRQANSTFRMIGLSEVRL